ncbi:Intracellular serine protease [Caulifigura coniformis]|uniref:Intracellular serine protease n=1 Tax=Caulifigura coniformis TaxID=2527983 RepID=A0A517SDB4_9PLAN|nr:S8 family serine peptidase [Caulifigura coniformis]QDT54111.1 Intracellular serine protease [Caulifigura coniformis]
MRTSEREAVADRGAKAGTLHIPGLTDLWSATKGDPRIMIAVLDGPVSLAHPAFSGARLSVAGVHGEATGASAAHGTHVASVIFGQHVGPVAGIAPNCRGVIIPVFKDGADGRVAPCSQIRLAEAITLAVEFSVKNGADFLVINISGGEFTPSGEAHPILEKVVRGCDRRKVLIVAAAGNQGCDCLHIPGAIPSVLAVGAMNSEGHPLEFSNWGAAYQAQGVLAPGENILGASPSGEVAAHTGTSYATPIVAGVAALLLSLQLRHGIHPSAASVRESILGSALGCQHRPVKDCRRLLAGRLNIPGAIALSLSKGQASMDSHLELGYSGTPGNVLPQGDGVAADVTTSAASIETPLPFSQVTCSSIENSMPELVMPSDCGCGGKKTSAPSFQKVYAIGKLSFDYGTRQRREYFANRIGGDPENHTNLFNYLTARPVTVDDAGTPIQAFDATGRPILNDAGNPLYLGLPHYTILNGPQFANRTDVTALTWILKIDETPIYAINPMGPFAFETHDTLTAFLRSQLPPPPPPEDPEGRRPRRGRREEPVQLPGIVYGEGVERIAVPGVIIGETRLYTGEQVPVLAPDHRGIANWTTDALIDAITAHFPAGGDDLGGRGAIEMTRDILDRMYELTRNLGISSRDRALNYAATDALQLQGILADPANQSRFVGMELDTIEVEKSPICRPDYDCWDVVIIFFNPDNLQQARRGIRYTIDVSDVMPHILSGSQRVFTLR